MTAVSLLDAVRSSHPSGIDALIDLVSDATGFAALASLVKPGGARLRLSMLLTNRPFVQPGLPA